MGIETLDSWAVKPFLVIATSSLYGDWNRDYISEWFSISLLQLPRYMGIETLSVRFSINKFNIATSSLYGDWNIYSRNHNCCFGYCNFLVIWGLKQILKTFLVFILSYCNFLVIWGLKLRRRSFWVHVWKLLQLPRYMGIETPIMATLRLPMDIATSSLYGDWNKIANINAVYLFILQLPRYMGIETAKR